MPIFVSFTKQELVELGSPASSFHLVGFSLGAHVAGLAGKRVPGLGRITGRHSRSLSCKT